MSKTFYNMMLRVEAHAIGTILAALDGSAKLVKLEECEPPADAPRTSRPGMRGNGHREDGTRIDEVVLQALKDGKPKTLTQISEVVESYGWMPGSASAALSKLAVDEQVRRVSKGVWQRVLPAGAVLAQSATPNGPAGPGK